MVITQYKFQLVFFGYPTYLLSAGKNRLNLLVRAWIEEISADFDHMLILEELDTSLAVMMIKFCWNVDDVAHLKVRLKLTFPAAKISKTHTSP